MTTVLAIFFSVVSLLIVLAVLVQRGRGAGIAGALGGAGGPNSALGVKASFVFTVVTIILFALFLGCAIGLNMKMQADNKAHLHASLQTTEQKL